MALDRERTQTSTVRVAPAARTDTAAIDAAIELGNRARARLGYLPFAAYRDAAAKGTLLLAHGGDQVVGYALFGLTRRRVRLTHLCVDPEWRGRGVARQLVEWISSEHADYPGILAKCRADYKLGEMWIALGFVPMSERPGRSRAGHALVSWWRDHHHSTLFTRDDDSFVVRAAIDLNVVRDLVEPGRADADEALALIDYQFADRLELVRTAALDREINNMDGPLRARCTTGVQQLTSLRSGSAQVQQIIAELTKAAQVSEPGYPRDDQDRFDLAHVAEAIAAGVHVLITRDARLARVSEPTAQQHGLRILRPADTLIHLDELARAEAYRPAALLGTSFRQQLIGAARDAELATLTNQATRERPRELLKTIRRLALAGHDRIGIYNPDGGLVAAFTAIHEEAVLAVPLLRVANTALADTLARQILFQLRQQARDRGATIIRITDPYPSAPVRLAAINDGFRQHADTYFAFVVDTCAPAAEAERHAVVAARQASVPEPASLRSGMPAVAAAELERTWWPAKATDSDLPTYLIPIQQAFSAELLGVPEGLLRRRDSLGLAREHVYYRSAGGIQPQAPARLLWYMSRGGSSAPYPSAIIACSQLDAVVNGAPEDLFDQFQHLGVWTQRRLFDVATSGIVQALRFTNTELLTHIPLARLRAVAEANRQSGIPPQQPLRISAGMFADLYQEGRSR